MKLGAYIFVISALAVTGCASTCPASAPAQPASVPVSTTRLTSAELPETEYAPLVGKQQNASAVAPDDQAEPKDARRSERHQGGGFSGYK